MSIQIPVTVAGLLPTFMATANVILQIVLTPLIMCILENAIYVEKVMYILLLVLQYWLAVKLRIVMQQEIHIAEKS